MKTPSLLFSLPLLITTLAAQTAPPAATASSEPILTGKTGTTTASVPPATKSASAAEDTVKNLIPVDEEGLSRLLIRGARRYVQIMTDQFHVRRQDGKQVVMRLPAAGTPSDTDYLACLHEQSTGDRTKKDGSGEA